MKPIAVVLSLAVVGIAAAQSARAQWPPYGGPAPLWPSQAPEVPPLRQSPFEPWGKPPLPPNPYEYLWEDYRGAAIEHDIYGKRWKRRKGTHRPIVSLLSWLDNLFCFLAPPPRKSIHAGATCQAPGTTETACCHCRCATPSYRGCYPPTDSSPLTPSPEPAREDPLADLLQEHVPPSRENTPAPVDSPPPQRLIPGRSPVVELAPDPVVPLDSLPPRNRVPRPGEQLPRNAVPR